MESTYEETYKGFTIKILPDNDSGNSPRDWDNAGKMVCWHRRYNLGDEQPRENPSEWLLNLLQSELDYDSLAYQRAENMEIPELLTELEKFYIFLPLNLYDHSGISISTSSFIGRAQHAEWDSGQVGWIYISKKDAVKEWGSKLFTKIVEQKAVKYLQGEVKTYDDYLTGNVYGYIVEDKDGERVDSCWGFYPEENDKTGYDYCLAEAREHVDWEVEQAKQKQGELARVHLAEIAFSE
jgi:hypothetical protein